MVDAGVAVRTGTDTTLMVKDTLLLPQPVLPLTVYTVLDNGEKVLEEPEPAGNQTYEVPPLTLTVTGVPLHTVVLLSDAESPLDGDTVIAVVAVALQPPVVPATVYDVPDEGLRTIVAPVCPPGCHW